MIMNGDKTIEIRSWAPRKQCPPYRIAIVAGKNPAVITPYLEGIEGLRAETYRHPGCLVRGQILGDVLLTGIKEYAGREEYLEDMKIHRAPLLYWRPRTKGWQFDRPRKLANPIPYKGVQGMFDIPDTLLEELK